MRKIKRNILTGLCVASMLGAVGTGLTLANALNSETPTPVATQTTNTVSAYYVNGKQSTYAYGSVQAGEENATLNGVVAKLYPKEQLVMRGVIDLREKDGNDLLISTTMVPETAGLQEVGELYYQIVDAYDPTNYVTVRMTPYPHRQEGPGTWFTAFTMAYASNGQKPTGKDRDSNRIHVNNAYGTWTSVSFHGLTGNSHTAEQNGFGISYDIETNVVYTYDAKRNVFIPVADFDNIDYFGANTWKGFTTGEVYVNVYAGAYEMEAGRVVVTEYNGYDLTQASIEDTEGPTIGVDYGDYSATEYPLAVAGYTYQLFKPTAFDVYTGESEVKTEVYLDYYTSNPAKQSVNRRTLEFKPSVPGIYTVVYSAEDAFGNKSQKLVDIDARASSEVDPLVLDIIEAPASALIGDIVAVPEVETRGEIGKSVLKKSATLNGQALEIKDDTLFVEKTGKLKITYELSDYSGRKVKKTVEITVNATDKPTFIEYPTLPKYFVEGNSYALPALSAYNYTDGSGAEIPTVIKVKKAGETTATTIEGAYVPTIANHKDTVEIIYEATVNGKSATWSQFIPVYKTRTDNKMDMSKYFDCKDGVATALKDGMQLNAMGNASFTFINSIYSSDLSLELRMLEDSKNLSKVHIRLTDYYDENNEIVFTYENGSTQTQCYINGDESVKLPVSTLFKNETLFTLNYKNDTSRIFYDVANNNYWTIDKNTAGAPFNGFAGNEFYVTIELEKANDSNASLALQRIFRNLFTTDTRDYVGPVITVLGEYGGEKKIGETFVVPEALIFDVFDGKVSGTYTITDPDGNVVTSKEGVYLEDVKVGLGSVSIVMDKFGAYEVSYFAVDSYNNKLNYNYIIRVVDDTVPTLEVVGELQATAKLGEKVYVPKFRFSDDKTSAEELNAGVYVVCPNGLVQVLDRATNVGFVANQVGEYQVIYYVYDEEGNQTVVVRTLMVTEE